MNSRTRIFQIALGVLVVIWLVQGNIVSALVDYFWFDALGFKGVFTTILSAKLGLWFMGAALSSVFIGVNLAVATREAPIDFRRAARLVLDRGLTGKQLQGVFRVAVGAWLALPGLLFGTTFASLWLQVLSWLHAKPFGVTDPVFNRDIGFYVFKLPLLADSQDLLAALVAITILPLMAFYFMRDVFVGQRNGLSDRARMHLLSLGAVFFLVLGFGWYLDTYELLFERHGVVWGMGYADLNGSLPARWIMAGVSVLTAVGLVVSTRRRNWRIPLGAAGLYGLCWVLLEGVWPGVLQNYYVSPNELDVEAPFIADNIKATREAYALDRIEVRAFEANTNLKIAEIDANPLTIDNIRVWDDRPLLDTYAQIQEIRPYYDFVDVDVDRYVINGALRQVMLSSRELNYSAVENKSWVNEHFQYTHGHGLAMSPVNAVTDRGLPELFIQDIPPVSNTDLIVTRPEIYYGELTSSYVFTNTTTDEFDYPDGDENQYNRYSGTGGVPAGSFGRKAVFALHFSSLDILLSNYLTDESKVHFRRQVRERVDTVTPFLSLDQDPYMVVLDGRLVWVVDAYTTTRNYPYSEPNMRNGTNYVRNAVKVVIDAYDGSLHYYIADPDDPIIQVYASIFPEVFSPMEELPAGLLEHLRYPVDFFERQAQVYARYHMNNVGVFYNAEDLWALPERDSVKNKPNYLIMKLPGEDAAEFVLLVPFVPKDKQNMIAWLAARSDGEDHGEMILYQFPKQKLIFGPEQIEARINQDPEISKEMTLWNQSGSTVTRGDLLVIPIEDSLVYVMPLYLEAASSKLPELKRVLVTYENRIAMERTLEESLAVVFGASAPPPTMDADGVAIPVVLGTWASLADDANASYLKALEMQQAGDWAGYGLALKDLEGELRKLQELARDAVGDMEGEPSTESVLPAPEQEQPQPE